TDETTAIKKAIASPDAINYKGITISPAGSFLAAETAWRQGATGGDINTAFTGIPLNHSEASQLSEFFGSGRQSRIALKAVGKLPRVTLTRFSPADGIFRAARVGRWPRKPRRVSPAERRFCPLPSTRNTKPALCGGVSIASA